MFVHVYTYYKSGLLVLILNNTLLTGEYFRAGRFLSAGSRWVAGPVKGATQITRGANVLFRSASCPSCDNPRMPELSELREAG